MVHLLKHQFSTLFVFFACQDLAEAAKWFEKAALKGKMEAMINLAKMTAKVTR